METFEYNGKSYSMTEEELLAAFYHQKKKFHTEDAKTQINLFALGAENPEAQYNDAELEARKEAFCRRYQVKYEDVSSPAAIANIVDTFEYYFDCNSTWNDMWEIAIEMYIRATAKA